MINNESDLRSKTSTAKGIQSRILTIRNQQVMIDRDLAELYGVETRILIQAVKRNIERFPDTFMFQLNEEEFGIWKSQFVTSKSDDENLTSQIVMSSWGGLRRAPYAFTEQGVAMLSSVLKSETAIQVSIQIIKAFVSMRHFLQNNMQLFNEIVLLKHHQIESDKRIDELFNLMDKYKIDDTQGIFFQGQIFDAYAKFESFIAQAQKEIILIDNYVNLSILERFAKKKPNVNIKIWTNPKTSLTSQDIQKFNSQYPTLTVYHTTKIHDRFLIIDQTILYHIGASLKDLGKKCFAFEILDNALIPHLLANV